MLHTDKLNRLLDNADHANKARLFSVSGKGSAHVLTANPGDPGCALTNEAYRIMIRHRIGLPPTRVAFRPNPTCDLCGKINVNEYHGLDCSKLKRRSILWRHDRIVHTVASSVRETGGCVSIEPRLHMEDRKKPDLKILLGNNVIWADVVVTNPTAPSHIARASQRRFGATDDAEAKKHKKYSEEVKKVGGHFVAFNLETYGAFGNGADNLVNQILAAYQPEFASAPAATIRRLLTRRVACAIHSMNAVAIQEWLNTANVLSEPNWREVEADGVAELEPPEDGEALDT